VSKPQRRAHAPLSGGLEGGDQNLYAKSWVYLYNLIGGSQQHHKALTTPWISFWGDFFQIGFYEAKSNKFLNGMDEEIKYLRCKCRSRYPPLNPKRA
jgi:hypothetical protein